MIVMRKIRFEILISIGLLCEWNVWWIVKEKTQTQGDECCFLIALLSADESTTSSGKRSNINSPLLHPLSFNTNKIIIKNFASQLQCEVNKLVSQNSQPSESGKQHVTITTAESCGHYSYFEMFPISYRPIAHFINMNTRILYTRLYSSVQFCDIPLLTLEVNVNKTVIPSLNIALPTVTND